MSQRKAGFNAGNSRLTIRGLASRNRVPALVGAKHTHLTLIEAELTGEDDASEAAVVLAGPKVFVRDLEASGYAHTIQASDGSFVDGAIDEWYEGKGHSPSGAEPRTLRLPTEETPQIPWETDLPKWVRIEPGRDTAQRAFDAAAATGAATVYFPKILEGKGEGRFKLTRPIRVHGRVNRILGMENIIDVADPDGAFANGKALFTFEDLTSDALVVERFFLLGGWKCPPSVHMFENRSGKTIVIQNVNHAGVHKTPGTGGKWFIEDVSPSRQGALRIGKGERCWARQLNPESPRMDMIEVDGGQLWILGLKTEGRSRHIVARNGARVELLGGVSYQSWGKQPIDPPMFTVIDSEASLTFGFYHWRQPFTTIVEETRGGETERLLRKELVDYHLPVYRAGGTR
jgi:hypothetical protein